MNILDIIILVCFIPAIINGIRKGLVAQVVAIVSIVLGVWLAFRCSSALGAWLSRWAGGVSSDILNIVSFTLIVIVVIFLLYAIGKILEKSIRIIMLGWLDRLLGFVFAIVKCALVIGLVIIMFESLNANIRMVSEEYLADSVLYTAFRNTAYAVYPYLRGLLFK